MAKTRMAKEQERRERAYERLTPVVDEVLDRLKNLKAG